MSWSTADLCDAYAETVLIAEPVFCDFGGRRQFCGPVSTVRAWEDNSLVREALEEAGDGRVLVVDGGGSRRCALLGDKLAQLACDHGWSGIVIYACVRDSAELQRMPLGVRALAACPLRSVKRNEGQREVSLRFAGIAIQPGDYLYADADGVITASQRLH
jgi:regulator of ribonuclease activity A